jgi:hypothetical protein
VFLNIVIMDLELKYTYLIYNYLIFHTDKKNYRTRIEVTCQWKILKEVSGQKRN